MGVTLSPPRPGPPPVPPCWADAPAEQLLSMAERVFAHADPSQRRAHGRAVTAAVDWLTSQPGDDWQQRWLIAGADAAGEGWVGATLPHDAHAQLTSGVLALVCLDAIRPGYRWVAGQRLRVHHKRVLHARASEQFSALWAEADRRGVPASSMNAVMTLLSRMLVVTGREPTQLVADDFTDYAQIFQPNPRVRTLPLETAWTLLSSTGGLVGAPATLRQHRRAGRLGVAELVDRYPIAARPVRDLFVRYLSERAPALDYTTLQGLAGRLVGLFWCDLERHHPGIDSLRLTPEVVTDWKARLARRPDGSERIDYPNVLLGVRAFYLDLVQWAAADPDTWAAWAAPCPIREADLMASVKARRRRRAHFHQRTRTLAPVLPALAAAAERRRDEGAALLAATTAAPLGATFTIDNHRFTRVGRAGSSLLQVTTEDGTRLRPAQFEDETFWAWALLEVLRQTGLRIEEALELTHLSLRRYTQPSGETVPLLQVSPSKTDTERVLPVAPELAAVLARIVRRIKVGADSVPLVVRYDGYEHAFGPPLPHLFQRRIGARPAVMSTSHVHAVLTALAQHADLRDVDGTMLRFSPHDFRRVFATETVNAGLPIHIAAKLLGHLDLNTTQGYVAVYPDVVVRHYRDFITNRRRTRPEDDYREPTADEWNDFEQHFALRKVALGTCSRPYGTPCVHEHACVRCPMLRIDPAQLPRLDELQHSAEQRLVEARQMTWLGEVSALEESLRHIAEKKKQASQLITEPALTGVEALT